MDTLWRYAKAVAIVAAVLFIAYLALMLAGPWGVFVLLVVVPVFLKICRIERASGNPDFT